MSAGAVATGGARRPTWVGRRAATLLGRRVVAGLAAAHGGGALLVGLMVAVEAAEVPVAELPRVLAARVPPLWVQLAPVLTMLGAALAAWRMRAEGAVLALAACGVAPRALILAGALAGAAVGGVAGGVEGWAPPPAPGAWVRGTGGWWVDGVAVPDVPGTPVGPPPSTARPRAADVASGAAGGALGAGLGLGGGPGGVVVATAGLVVGEALARGLAERGAVPPVGTLMPAVGALIALAAMASRGAGVPRR